MMSTKEILLGEDNPGDILLLQEALQRLAESPCLTVVGDGIAALALLRRRAALSPPQLPELVLLDLNLPRMGGWEVLDHLRGDPVLRGQPVMILTGSKGDRRLIEAHGLPAERYLVKPDSFQGFVEMVGRITRFFAAEPPS